jgi:hypothetical protein
MASAMSVSLVVVPPGLDHAFAAGAGRGCELLVVFAPGLDRFGYFRTLIHVARGELPPERLREVAPGYDTFFTRSPAWGRH